MTSARPVALVTGASRGLGAAIAARLGAAGHPIAVNYAASATAAEAVAEDIRGAGGVARAYRADVTDEHEAARLVQEVRSDLGPVGVLVLNATGPQPEIPVADVRWEDVRAQLDFFVKSPVLLLGGVRPDMRAAGWGRIVHIGSDSVRGLPAGSTAYVTAKSAQLALARMWAAELGPPASPSTPSRRAGSRWSATGTPHPGLSRSTPKGSRWAGSACPTTSRAPSASSSPTRRRSSTGVADGQRRERAGLIDQWSRCGRPIPAT